MAGAAVGAPALEAQVRVRRGDFVLDAAVRVEPGEVLAVLGPNGSGKSTLLATLAGLIVPEEGMVSVFGRPLTLVAGGAASVRVPAERRGVGLLGQDALLFPHLSAAANVAFGRRAQGARKAAALQVAVDWLEAVGLPDYAGRRPHELSGGQQQRVAIARALAARPDVLLLDEPMGALDVQTAVLIRDLLREQLRANGTSAVVVTHDVLDAMVLADRIAILHDGRIVDEGAVATVLGRPRNAFIAALAGVNLVQGRAASDGALETDDGRRFAGRAPVAVAAGALLAGAFRPSAVALVAAPAAAGHANCWRTTVTSLDAAAGGIRLVTSDGVAAELPAAEVARVGLRAGAEVWLQVTPADITLWEG